MPNKLKISEQDIEFSHDVKYLGVTLDSKMLWDVHFSNTIKRAKQYLFMLKKAVYKAWGPKPILIKWIYTAIVRPRITYCAIAWSHTLRYTTRKITINKLNRLAATMITPVRRSTPIKACLLYTSPSPRD